MDAYNVVYYVLGVHGKLIAAMERFGSLIPPPPPPP